MINKKIFFIADANSIHTVKWVDYFIEKNYDVYIATFAKDNKTKCKNIYYLGKPSKVGGGNYHYLLSIYKLAQIIKEIKPDMINAHYSYSMGFVGLLALKFAKIDSTFSVVCHGDDILRMPFYYITKKINRFVLKNSDKIFAVSDQIKDEILKYGINENKIFTGQYGVKLLENNISNKKDIDILSNRAYIEDSRIDFLLESLNKLANKKLNIVFVLPLISDDKYEYLRNRYPFITFYKSVEYTEMMELMKRSKIYISATVSDGTSLSLLESLNYDLIPVISNIVSNRSWILDSINGYLYDTEEDFVNKLKLALSLEQNDVVNINMINKKLLKYKGSYKNQMSKIEEFLLKK